MPYDPKYSESTLCGRLKTIEGHGLWWGIHDAANGKTLALRNGGVLEIFNTNAKGHFQTVVSITVDLDYSQAEQTGIHGQPTPGMGVEEAQWQAYFKEGWLAAYTPPCNS